MLAPYYRESFNHVHHTYDIILYIYYQMYPFVAQFLLTDVEALHWFIPQERDLELVVDVDANVPRLAHGDPGRLRQVLINLVSNAGGAGINILYRIILQHDGMTLA
mgnify:CR=1 FL=1